MAYGNLLSCSMPKGLTRRTFLGGMLAAAPLSLLALEESRAETYRTIEQLNADPDSSEAIDGVYWNVLRRHFLFEDDLIMMNNGTVGPMPRPVFNTLMRAFRLQVTNPYDVYNHLPSFKEAVRTKCAAFIGADPDEVALTSNTTEGINIVANGLDLEAGDEILMTNLEHPGQTGPWSLKAARSGAVIREVPLPVTTDSIEAFVDPFEKALTSRTRIIAIGHTIFITGLIAPLRELCRMARERGVLVLADSAHGIGMLDLNMHELGIDFFTTSPYKWMGTPTGIGVLYIRRQAQEGLWPTIVSSGWESPSGARRYEPKGQRADAMVLALDEALDFQNAIGKGRIDRRIKDLAAYLKMQLEQVPGVHLHTPHDRYLSAGLTAFSLEGVAPARVVDHAREKYNLVVRTIGNRARGTYGVRASTPIYVGPREVDLLVESVRECMA